LGNRDEGAREQIAPLILMAENIMAKDDIEISRLKELLSYDDASGCLTWIARRGNNDKHIGREAGRVHKLGYRVLGIDYKMYYAHRICWALYYESWPDGMVDHINCIKTDNRIENLRVCTRSLNVANRKVQSNNKVGIKGVFKRRKRWETSIVKDGERVFRGSFATLEEAASAYAAQSERFFGEFSRVE
jgi:hypothetical protein